MSHDKNSKIRKFKVADGRRFQTVFLYIIIVIIIIIIIFVIGKA